MTMSELYDMLSSAQYKADVYFACSIVLENIKPAFVLSCLKIKQKQLAKELETVAEDVASVTRTEKTVVDQMITNLEEAMG